MSIYTADELFDELAETIARFGDETPIRWSDDPQGGAAATRHLTLEVKSLHGRPTVLVGPALTDASETPPVETLADFVRVAREEADAYGLDLPIFWSNDAVTGIDTRYLTAELEMLDGIPTVVIFPA